MSPTDPQNTTTIIDTAADKPALAAALRQLGADVRRALAEALADIEAAETDQTIVTQARAMMTALYPDRPVRGVVFRYATCGDVLFQDGEAIEDASFDDVYPPSLNDLLTSVSDRSGGHPMIAVDLRAETVTAAYRTHSIHKGASVHRLFGEPEPD